jgi:hypothetical protein
VLRGCLNRIRSSVTLRGGCLVLAFTSILFVTGRRSLAVDQTFNIVQIAERDPLAGSLPGFGCTGCVYGDVWAENGFAYLGTDVNAGGVNIFSFNNAGVPTFIRRYAGDQFEDVEVWDGIGYFGSDVTTATGGTGVDIVDLAAPSDPVMLSRVNGSDCLIGSTTVCGHNKVHTLSVVTAPNNNTYLYTSDNATDVVKITNVTDPANPQLVASVDMGLASNIFAHEVIVRNNRMYVASKNNGSNTTDGWVNIYDVQNPASPVLLKKFLSGARTHTALPSDNGNILVVAEERQDGNVKIYDISMINSANDPDNPVLLSTLNRTSVGIDAHSPHHAHLHGNLLFLPWYEAGLQVFNIVDPAHPVRVGSFDTFPGTSTVYNGDWGVDLSQGLGTVFLSDRSRGLIAVDARGVVATGDYNQDMFVNATDYNVWRASFGNGSSGLHVSAFADGNYNDVVDAADYVLWRKHNGETGPSHPGAAVGAAVPEPAGLVLLVIGIGAMSSRRRVR